MLRRVPGDCEERLGFELGELHSLMPSLGITKLALVIDIIDSLAITNGHVLTVETTDEGTSPRGVEFGETRAIAVGAEFRGRVKACKADISGASHIVNAEVLG